MEKTMSRKNIQSVMGSYVSMPPSIMGAIFAVRK